MSRHETIYMNFICVTLRERSQTKNAAYSRFHLHAILAKAKVIEMEMENISL